MNKKEANFLIKSDEFVREPVDMEVNKILDMDSKRIILTGGRGTGKSVVLNHLEKRGLGSNEQTLYFFPKRENIEIRKDERILDSLYELYFSSKILKYIRENYPIAFEKYFKSYYESISKLGKDFEHQLNNMGFVGDSIDCLLETKEFSSDLLKELRQKLNIDKLNLAIDRFDWIDGSYRYFQEKYVDYFDMFDKVILTSDIPTLDSKELINRGYGISKVSYGANKDVLREIIRRNKSLRDKDLFTSDLFLDKLTKLDGNIDLSLEVLEEFSSRLDWDIESSKDDEKVLDHVIKVKQGNAKILDKRRLRLNKLNFYL